jgi:hypothetical protein
MADAWLEAIPHADCLRLLRDRSVGRVAFISEGFPLVLPVNYRLVEVGGATWIALRTRPGNAIDRAGLGAAFEIDDIDPVKHQGWSVVVRGTLQHVDPDAGSFSERFNPEPWLLADRDAWLVIEPFAITGRRLHAAEPQWAFHLRAYFTGDHREYGL